MRFFTRTAFTGQRFAATSVLNLLDNQLILILRAWGSSEYNQIFTDEITHYLSSTQADLDVTTPFKYQENLSALANRTRVSLLLAHDLFYKSENKNEYSVGFEAAVLFKSKNQLAWSSVGRFAIDKVRDNSLGTLMKCGSDLDSEVLLPVQLIGVEREIDINSGSMNINESDKIVISSTFKCDIQVNDSTQSIESLIDIKNTDGVYWYSIITSG